MVAATEAAPVSARGTALDVSRVVARGEAMAAMLEAAQPAALGAWRWVASEATASSTLQA
jgi:hypothetical protein